MTSSIVDRFHGALTETGLVAILRGVQPDEVVAIGQDLYDAGFRLIEVPLNSPQPLVSIERLVAALPADAIVGAGTVLNTDAVRDVHAAGGRLVVMPHADLAVVRAARERDMAVTPGVATPTEAFAAIHAGATGIKAFPAEQIAPAVVKAWRAVLPAGIPVVPVGGITPDNMGPYLAAGANGFGLGSALYRKGDGAAVVAANARAFVTSWRALRAG